MSNFFSETDFAKLIYDNQALISKVTNIYCNAAADREDLFQEIVVRLWKGLASFEGKSKISSWMYRVAINTAISYKRRSKKIIQLSEDYPEVTDDHPLTDESYNRHLEKGILHRAIQQLKKLDRAIILLHLEELPYDEIAQITGLSKNNVSVRIVRIKMKLKEKIQKQLKMETDGK